MKNLRRWRLSGPPGPRIEQAVLFGQAARAAALEAVKQVSGRGWFPDSLHKGDQHQHAHWIGEDRDGDGLIDHLAVGAHAPLDALDPLAKHGLLFLPSGRWKLIETDVRDEPAHLWVSATPFVGPNHAWQKPGRLKRGQDLVSQAHRELARLPDFPRILEISITQAGKGAPNEWTSSAHTIPRASPPRKRRIPNYPVWGWLAILTASPRSAPFSAGALSHWGLGAFRASSGIFHNLT